MSKQLHEIIPRFSQMDYEGKLAIVRRVRHNKYTVRPAFQKRKAKAGTSKKKASNKKIIDLMKGVSKEELAKIFGDLDEN